MLKIIYDSGKKYKRLCRIFKSLFNHICSMSIHIGAKIKEVFDKRGMTVSELGRRINKSRENIYHIFKRKTIDTGLLETISDVLEYDFFQYYTNLKEDVEQLKEENQNLKDALEFHRGKGED